jgi:mono/diheme cytochrome c family protein
MSTKKVVVAVSLLALTQLAACSKGGKSPSPAAQQEAAQLFATRCSVCHGAQGTGDGPGSAALTPKPRNFKDQAWQASVTDDLMEKIIIFGGATLGKSAAMPPNPDLAEKNEVLTALRMHIRNIGK